MVGSAISRRAIENFVWETLTKVINRYLDGMDEDRYNRYQRVEYRYDRERVDEIIEFFLGNSVYKWYCRKFNLNPTEIMSVVAFWKDMETVEDFEIGWRESVRKSLDLYLEESRGLYGFVEDDFNELVFEVHGDD